jgi:hypothetical protein
MKDFQRSRALVNGLLRPSSWSTQPQAEADEVIASVEADKAAIRTVRISVMPPSLRGTAHGMRLIDSETSWASKSISTLTPTEKEAPGDRVGGLAAGR